VRGASRSLLLIAAIGCLLAPPARAYIAAPPTQAPLDQDGQTGRYVLGGTWLYRPDSGDIGLARGWWRNVAATAGWTPVTIPNSYNASDFSSASMNGWVGWYRRDFALPAHAFASYVPADARGWIIGFESVNYYATVWVNGHEIGSHAGGYLPFEFSLRWLHSGLNRLIVRVDNRLSPTTLPPIDTAGDWWNFGGILDQVYLRPVQRADISQVLVRPLLACASCSATIDERAEIRNITAMPQKLTLTGSYGIESLRFGTQTIAPHATWIASAVARVAQPKLWAPGDPHLYRVTLTLSDARGRPLGGYMTYSGIRSIQVTSDGRLELNGRPLHLRGINLVEQTLLTGAALDGAQLQALIGWVRRLGATVIRAHYPLSPEIEQLADRDGILIWSEIPVFQVADQYLQQPAWLAFARAMLEQNIVENQNHPSVMLWSIGNELTTPPTPQDTDYIADAVALAHKLDPTRPVGMAIADWPGIPCQQAYAPLEVIGYNDYFGWYDSGGGVTDDRDGLSPFLDSLRACYPDKAIFVTEFGFEASRTGPVEVRGTYQFQSNAAAYHLHVFATKPWLSGAMYSALQDFAVGPGWTGGNPWPDPPFDQKGLIDRYGDPKPAFAIVSRIYHATVQISGRG
jgi:beta-glucuronidase